MYHAHVAESPKHRHRASTLCGPLALFCGMIVLSGSSLGADDDTIRFDFSTLGEVLPMDDRSALAVIGEGMKVSIDRPFARAQDRYVEVLVEVADRAAQMKASLRDPLAGGLLFEKTVTPKARRGRLLIDVRALGRKEVGLTLELVKDGSTKAVARSTFCTQTPKEPLRAGQRIGIGFDLPDGVEDLHAWPVTFFGTSTCAPALFHAGSEPIDAQHTSSVTVSSLNASQ